MFLTDTPDELVLWRRACKLARRKKTETLQKAYRLSDGGERSTQTAGKKLPLFSVSERDHESDERSSVLGSTCTISHALLSYVQQLSLPIVRMISFENVRVSA